MPAFELLSFNWESLLLGLLPSVLVARLRTSVRWLGARIGASPKRSTNVDKPLVVLEHETFGEPVNQWLTLKVLNSSEKSMQQCYGRIVAFGPLHRGYPAKQQTPQGGERLPWLVSSGDLRHYVTIEPQSSQNLAVLHREDDVSGSTFSIPTEPPAFVRLSPMDGYQMIIEFGREDTLGQLGKYLVIIRRDGDDVRLELQETEGETLPQTTF